MDDGDDMTMTDEPVTAAGFEEAKHPRDTKGRFRKLEAIMADLTKAAKGAEGGFSSPTSREVSKAQTAIANGDRTKARAALDEVAKTNPSEAVQGLVAEAKDRLKPLNIGAGRKSEAGTHTIHDVSHPDHGHIGTIARSPKNIVGNRGVEYRANPEGKKGDIRAGNQYTEPQVKAFRTRQQAAHHLAEQADAKHLATANEPGKKRLRGDLRTMSGVGVHDNGPGSDVTVTDPSGRTATLHPDAAEKLGRFDGPDASAIHGVDSHGRVLAKPSREATGAAKPHDYNGNPLDPNARPIVPGRSDRAIDDSTGGVPGEAAPGQAASPDQPLPDLPNFSKVKVEGRPDGAGTEEDPIAVGDDLDRAVQLLAEGKHVRLEQQHQVSTLLDKLAAHVEDVKARGDKAPEINLCQISVPGTNLFCAEHKGIERTKMPQLSGHPEPGSPAEAYVGSKGEADITEPFIRALQERGISITEKRVPASHLKASQMELDGPKVVGIAGAMEAGKVPEAPIFVTRDGYIIDGHHRWAANVTRDLRGLKPGDDLGNVQMPVRELDMDIGAALDFTNAFALDMGIRPKGLGAKAEGVGGDVPHTPAGGIQHTGAPGVHMPIPGERAHPGSAQTLRDSGFKPGDRVQHNMRSRDHTGKVSQTLQPQVHEIAGVDRNDNAVLRHPETGTTYHAPINDLIKAPPSDATALPDAPGEGGATPDPNADRPVYRDSSGMPILPVHDRPTIRETLPNGYRLTAKKGQGTVTVRDQNGTYLDSYRRDLLTDAEISQRAHATYGGENPAPGVTPGGTPRTVQEPNRAMPDSGMGGPVGDILNQQAANRPMAASNDPGEIDDLSADGTSNAADMGYDADTPEGESANAVHEAITGTDGTPQQKIEAGIEEANRLEMDNPAGREGALAVLRNVMHMDGQAAEDAVPEGGKPAPESRYPDDASAKAGMQDGLDEINRGQDGEWEATSDNSAQGYADGGNATVTRNPDGTYTAEITAVNDEGTEIASATHTYPADTSWPDAISQAHGAITPLWEEADSYGHTGRGGGDLPDDPRGGLDPEPSAFKGVAQDVITDITDDIEGSLEAERDDPGMQGTPFEEDYDSTLSALQNGTPLDEHQAAVASDTLDSLIAEADEPRKSQLQQAKDAIDSGALGAVPVDPAVSQARYQNRPEIRRGRGSMGDNLDDETPVNDPERWRAASEHTLAELQSYQALNTEDDPEDFDPDIEAYDTELRQAMQDGDVAKMRDLNSNMPGWLSINGYADDNPEDFGQWRDDVHQALHAPYGGGESGGASNDPITKSYPDGTTVTHFPSEDAPAVTAVDLPGDGHWEQDEYGSWWNGSPGESGRQATNDPELISRLNEAGNRDIPEGFARPGADDVNQPAPLDTGHMPTMPPDRLVPPPQKTTLYRAEDPQEINDARTAIYQFERSRGGRTPSRPERNNYARAKKMVADYEAGQGEPDLGEGPIDAPSAEAPSEPDLGGDLTPRQDAGSTGPMTHAYEGDMTSVTQPGTKVIKRDHNPDPSQGGVGTVQGPGRNGATTVRWHYPQGNVQHPLGAISENADHPAEDLVPDTPHNRDVAAVAHHSRLADLGNTSDDKYWRDMQPYHQQKAAEAADRIDARTERQNTVASRAPSDAEKIANAETMYGTNSPQHQEAQRRFGGTPPVTSPNGRSAKMQRAFQAASEGDHQWLASHGFDAQPGDSIHTSDRSNLIGVARPGEDPRWHSVNGNGQGRRSTTASAPQDARMVHDPAGSSGVPSDVGGEAGVQALRDRVAQANGGRSAKMERAFRAARDGDHAWLASHGFNAQPGDELHVDNNNNRVAMRKPDGTWTAHGVNGNGQATAPSFVGKGQIPAEGSGDLPDGFQKVHPVTTPEEARAAVGGERRPGASASDLRQEMDRLSAERDAGRISESDYFTRHSALQAALDQSTTGNEANRVGGLTTHTHAPWTGYGTGPVTHKHRYDDPGHTHTDQRLGPSGPKA